MLISSLVFLYHILCCWTTPILTMSVRGFFLILLDMIPAPPSCSTFLFERERFHACTYILEGHRCFLRNAGRDA